MDSPGKTTRRKLKHKHHFWRGYKLFSLTSVPVNISTKLSWLVYKGKFAGEQSWKILTLYYHPWKVLPQKNNRTTIFIR